jgi:hypothetical protein
MLVLCARCGLRLFGDYIVRDGDIVVITEQGQRRLTQAVAADPSLERSLLEAAGGNGKTADSPTDTGALSGSVMKNPVVMEALFNAARDQLAKQASVDPQRIAAVGYCFGGAVALNRRRLTPATPACRISRATRLRPTRVPLARGAP